MRHPLFTDEHDRFRASVRAFVEAELAPHAEDWEREGHVPDRLQVHGGYGYMTEFPVQRAWRDARLGPIGGGHAEMMKDLIGRSLGL